MNFAHMIFEGSFKMKIKKAIAHTNASNFLYFHKTIIQKINNIHNEHYIKI